MELENFYFFCTSNVLFQDEYNLSDICGICEGISEYIVMPLLRLHRTFRETFG